MKVFEKVYKGSLLGLYNEIVSKYDKQGYCVVNFVYMACLSRNKVYSDKKNDNQKLYETAIENCDFLLSDGIAMQIVYLLRFFAILPNLNGTDLIPFIMEEMIKDKKIKNINLILNGGFPQDEKKIVDFVKKSWGLRVFDFQHGYRLKEGKSVFDPSVLDKLGDGINILLTSRGPTQGELRTIKHLDIIKKYNLLVFNLGGSFDRWSGRAKRAPKIIKYLKLEWFRRLCEDPKKNRVKVYNSLFFLKLLLKKSL